ncbi:tigger transposable element-derived protein 4-like [Saccostrea echinata]|uniref:tigger transposable element-derived protein 4-like n=1 Tax=Saccostrea echinata TaxID=191078 RepID=UPI002A7F5E39|nr:tigger transposable element-derived protein 4-like [Saccostrea echinata]
MSLKRKRTVLTLSTKYEIVKLLDQKVSQSEIGRRYGIAQSSISTISKNRTKIKENYESCGNPERKRQRSGNKAHLDSALKEWFQTARQRDIPISGPILQEKAAQFAKQMNVTDFNASKGWLSRFKARENIGFKKLHGEKKDADTDAANRWITEVLPEMIRDYKAEDIYNADKTGIYYRAIPDSTHTFKNEIASGSKKCKDRVTALVCANMSGDDKRKLLIIGKSKDPRCFRGKSLPVMYRANKNSWMTGEIFSEWIREFEEFINHDNTLQCHHVPTDEEICAEFMENRGAEEEECEESVEEDEEYEFELPLTGNEIRSMLKAFRRFYEENNEEDFQLIYNLEDKCEEILNRAKKQRKITEFIDWIP